MQIILVSIIYAAAFSSALLLLYAAGSGKYGWAYVSAAIATPICVFIAGYPALYYVPVVFPIGILMGAYYIKRNRPGWALLWFAPYLILWIGVLVTILVNMNS